MSDDLTGLTMGLRGLFVRAVIHDLDDEAGDQTLTLATHLGHVKSRVPVHYPFGFTSHAPIDGAVTMVLHAGGDHADPVALPPANPMKARMGGLKEGEAALYDAAGQKLHFRDGRLVQVDALEELNVAIAGETVFRVTEGKVSIDGVLHVNGDVEVQGDARLDGTLTAQQDVKSAGISLKNHAHLSAQPGQPTSPPQE